MDNFNAVISIFYGIILSPPGRVLFLSLVIGLATQQIKLTTPKETWLRALLPAIPILIGALCGVIPGVLTGEATVLMGAGAGALSSSAVELWVRYRDQAAGALLKKAFEDNGTSGATVSKPEWPGATVKKENPGEPPTLTLTAVKREEDETGE